MLLSLLPLLKFRRDFIVRGACCMPGSGTALADTLQTTWMNFPEWGFLCMCVLQITFSMFFCFCFDCNIGLREQNVHATSRMYIRSETVVRTVINITPAPFPSWNLSLCCPLMTFTAATGLSLHCCKMQAQVFGDNLECDSLTAFVTKGSKPYPIECLHIFYIYTYTSRYTKWDLHMSVCIRTYVFFYRY